jgi:hypothetical protein
VIYVGHKTLRPSGSGVVVLPVRCPAVALGACSGTLSLRGGKPRFAFGSSAFKMAPGKRAKIRIRLTRRARRLLARHSRVTIHLTVTSRDAGAVARARHWALTLKPPIRTRLR